MSQVILYDLKFKASFEHVCGNRMTETMNAEARESGFSGVLFEELGDTMPSQAATFPRKERIAYWFSYRKIFLKQMRYARWQGLYTTIATLEAIDMNCLAVEV